MLTKLLLGSLVSSGLFVLPTASVAEESKQTVPHKDGAVAQKAVQKTEKKEEKKTERPPRPINQKKAEKKAEKGTHNIEGGTTHQWPPK